MKSLTRIYGLDLARSFAVLFAMFSHCIIAFNSGASLRSGNLQIFIGASTPAFIVVFGVFLELVYFSNFKTRGADYAKKKLFSRAIQCYVLYAISCIVLAISADYSLKYLLRMLLLMGATPLSDILKFYAITLLSAPIILRVKSNYGMRPLVVFCLLVHLLHYIFYPTPYYQGFPGSDILFGFLYGATTLIAGPSLLHGITFVVAGMWLGECIRHTRERDRLLDLTKPAALYLFVGCLALIAFHGHYYGPGFLADLTGNKLRNSNAYIYFVFGIVGSMTYIDLSMRLAGIVGDQRIKSWVFLGNTSLFTFCFGNCILYIFMNNPLEKVSAVTATYASIAFIVLMSWTFNYVRGRISKMESTSKWLSTYHYVSKGYADQFAKKLVTRA